MAKDHPELSTKLNLTVHCGRKNCGASTGRYWQYTCVLYGVHAQQARHISQWPPAYLVRSRSGAGIGSAQAQ